MLRVVSVDHLTESNFILQAIGSPEKFSDRGVMRSDGQFPYGNWDRNWTSRLDHSITIMNNNGNINKASLPHSL